MLMIECDVNKARQQAEQACKLQSQAGSIPSQQVPGRVAVALATASQREQPSSYEGTSRSYCLSTASTAQNTQQHGSLVQVALRLLCACAQRIVAAVLPFGKGHKLSQVLFMGGHVGCYGCSYAGHELRIVRVRVGQRSLQQVAALQQALAVLLV
eukprot:1157325-Pelagomonas_calceolata.AAC.21